MESRLSDASAEGLQHRGQLQAFRALELHRLSSVSASSVTGESTGATGCPDHLVDSRPDGDPNRWWLPRFAELNLLVRVNSRVLPRIQDCRRKLRISTAVN